MRLLKVGRDLSCDIILRSEKVSALHAEMTILNSGDMLIEDKSSTNGTYIMNKRIKSGEPIPVRRGDAIRLADVELQWNMIPMPEDNSQFKALFGIGSNFRNEVKVSGNTLSRFHATLKIDKKKRAYIQDHSKNGTTVNGTKITPGNNVRIKRSDSIVCGGVPVDLRKYIPISDGNKVLWIACTAALIIGSVFLIKNLNFHRAVPINDLENATACVDGSFYVVVKLDDDPFKDVINGWPKEWIFGSQNDVFPVCQTVSVESDKVEPVSYTGTAFFITANGYMGTNRHIAVPWEYIDNMKKGAVESIKQKMSEIRNELLPLNELQTMDELYRLQNASRFTKLLFNYLMKGGFTKVKFDQINAWILRFKNSPIKISGKFVDMRIGLKGQDFRSESELLPCHVVAQSDDPDTDVGLLRLNNKKTPEDIVKKGFFDINDAMVDEKRLQPQMQDLITIGYPYGFILGLATENNTLKPTIHKISVSKDPDENKFQFQGEETSGASGSPIVDVDKHRLVGVLYGGYTIGSTYGLACNIKHLKNLYDKNKNKENE
jgi:pSer/pThr/pTyr-binding forkhead associated (FHA) protein